MNRKRSHALCQAVSRTHGMKMFWRSAVEIKFMLLCIIATYIAVLTLTSWAPSAGMWDSSVDTYLPQSKGNNRNVTALLSRNFEQRLPAARLYQQLGHACNNIGRLFDAES